MDFPQETFDKIVDFNNREYDGWDMLTVDEMKSFITLIDEIKKTDLYKDYLECRLSYEELYEKGYDIILVAEYSDFVEMTIDLVRDSILSASNDLWDTIFSRSFDAIKTLDQNAKLKNYVYYMLECAKRLKQIQRNPPDELKKIRAIYRLHTFVYNDKKVKTEQKAVKKDTNAVSTARTVSDKKRPSIK